MDYVQSPPPTFFSPPKLVLAKPLSQARQQLNGLHQRLEIARPPAVWGDDLDGLKEAWWRQRMQAISGNRPPGSRQATASELA